MEHLVALVGHLAWPAVVLVALVLVRREVRAIAERLAARIRPRTETLTDVPPKLVDQIVAGFTADGAAKIEKHIQPDGRLTVVAVFDASARASRKAWTKS